MKQLLSLLEKGLLLFAFLLFSFSLFAQCNVNERYDKIVSGYHSSIALKTDGVYSVWGSAMKSTGVVTTGDAFSPQDINATNYAGLTGTILKVALGGKNAGAAVDQAILLTTDGLWAWGIISNVLSSTGTPTVKSTAAFGRTYNTVANGFNAYGLPTSVTPTDVQSMFATYQTLIIVTKIVAGVGGDVWILTQTSLAVEGNNGTATTVGTSRWVRLMKSATAGDYLTNVVAVRGQVSNITYNAFMAQTSAGLVYTWGNSTYLGNGTAVVARTVATLMTLPSESGSQIIPRMIGVTGGIGTTATTTNTYFALSNSGNLYALGHNSQKQCGDFTTTERTSWVQVKKSVTAGDYLTNVNFITTQEHNSSFPAVAAVTSTGTMYTWGNNSSGMLARSDNGAVGGNLTTTTWDPGLTAGISGIVISAEMGGHTLVYLKEGTNQFCYAGHYVDGSMGDGGIGNNGSSSATILLLNCATTPNLAICGYVPVAASSTNSVISSVHTIIAANGSSTTTITVQLKDASGTNLTTSGGTVVIMTSAGIISTVTDNNDGTYTAVLTSSATPEVATLTFTINGTTASNSTQVTFASTLPLSWINATAYRQNKMVKIAWTTTNEINVRNFVIEYSPDGFNWVVVVPYIPAFNLSSANYYSQFDSTFKPNQLFYRIKQTGFDGHHTYSFILRVSSIENINQITVYPIPTYNSFHLGNVNPEKIDLVQVINIDGRIMKYWKSFQPSYNIEEMPPGIYIIRVRTKEGDIQNNKVSKQ
jgi:hypothetical protein